MNAQIRYLGSIGGKDVAETTRRVMHTLMKKSVAGRMNFAGRGGKKAVQKMKLMRVVIG